MAAPIDSSAALSAGNPAAKPPRKSGWILLLRSLIGLAGGVAVVSVVGHFSDVHPREVLQAIEKVPVWATLFCIASSFVVLALQSWRWHRVLGPLLGLRYVDAYRAQIVGFLFNALLPARGGDLLRVQYLGRRTGKSRATILGTELVDRWLDWWGWIPTFLVLAVVSHPPSWLFKALGVFAALLIAWAGGMALLIYTGWAPRPGTRIAKLFEALRIGVLAFRNPRIWVTALVVAPLPWLWEATAIAIAGRAFGLELSLVQSFSVMIAFNLAMVVPSPGGVGTIESGGMLALNFFHFDHDASSAFMFVYHFSQLLPGVMGGAAVLFAEGEKLFGTLAKVGDIPVDATAPEPSETALAK